MWLNCLYQFLLYVVHATIQIYTHCSGLLGTDPTRKETVIRLVFKSRFVFEAQLLFRDLR